MTGGLRETIKELRTRRYASYRKKQDRKKAQVQAKAKTNK